MTEIVNAVLVRDGTVLLARRGAGRAIYPDCWSFAGGHVEAGESRDEALVREMREEIGLTPRTYHKIDVIEDTRAERTVRFHMYLVTAWDGGEPVLIGEEHTELRWFAIEAAMALEDLALPTYREMLAGL